MSYVQTSAGFWLEVDAKCEVYQHKSSKIMFHQIKKINKISRELSTVVERCVRSWISVGRNSIADIKPMNLF